jgi:predicted oxidoreductase
VVASTLPELVKGMNKLTAEPLIDLADLDRQITARDREMDNPFTKDLQVMAIRNARRYRGDRLARTAAQQGCRYQGCRYQGCRYQGCRYQGCRYQGCRYPP